MAAFEETWRRIVSPMPPGQRERLAASVSCFLDGCFAEITSRAADRVLDYESYMCTRRNSVGGKMYFLLAEHGLQIDLTDDLPGHLPGNGPLGDLIATALDYLILTNDLFSFRAECIKNDFVNAVSAFIYQDGLGLQGAIDKLCDVIDTREREFLAKRDQTPRRSDRATTRRAGVRGGTRLHDVGQSPLVVSDAPLPLPRPRLERLDLRNRHPAP